jgi:DHA2 family methylenomycin A resistance protein-like MFS transporter
MPSNARTHVPTSGALTRDARNDRTASPAVPVELSRWLLLAVAIGTTLAPLNSTMIAVALPEIQDVFGVSVTATTLLVTLYLVAMAVGQPIGGRLGDLYGRRRVYLIGLIWFGVASAGCAFAPSLPILILFRAQQALAGALSFPNGTAMVREAVPEERRGSAFGTIGLATGLAAASGPPIGGVLVHAFGWAAIFWANIPVVATALLLGWRGLPRQALLRSGKRVRFDLAGSGLFAVSLGALIAIPTMLKLDRPVFAIAAGLAGLVSGVLFVRWELRSSAPVVDVRLFAQSQFAASCGSIGLSNLVMYTTLLALPLYLEGARGHSVQISGLVLAALSAFAAIWGPLGGRWTDRSGRRAPALFGAAALLIGSALLAIVVRGEAIIPVAVALALMGIGIGVSGAPVQTAAMESAPRERAGSAAGIYSTSRYLGSVVGSSVLAIVFVRRPHTGEEGRFIALFAGLALVALIGVFVNDRVADRR